MLTIFRSLTRLDTCMVTRNELPSTGDSDCILDPCDDFVLFIVS